MGDERMTYRQLRDRVEQRIGQFPELAQYAERIRAFLGNLPETMLDQPISDELDEMISDFDSAMKDVPRIPPQLPGTQRAIKCP
jgi:hypothetical protein